jgi:flagellar basal-body rod protein FlgG
VDPPGLFPELAAGDARPLPIAGAFPEDALVVQVSAAKESPLAKQLREEAERVFAENDANQRTIGFKRTQIVLLNVSISTVNADAISTDVLTSAEAIPTVGDETASEQSQSSAVYWLTRLDLRPGGMKQTGNPLDLMINGPGWLQVERNGRYEFVRSGMLGFRDDGRLGIHTGVGLLPIVPAIQFPIERQRIVIAESGEIYSETADGHEKLDSQLVSVNFRDASALKRTAAGTYTVTNDSGPALDTRPGFVTFLQAVLEESNVDIDTELADVMRLKAIAGQLAVQP